MSEKESPHILRRGKPVKVGRDITDSDYWLYNNFHKKMNSSSGMYNKLEGQNFQKFYFISALPFHQSILFYPTFPPCSQKSYEVPVISQDLNQQMQAQHQVKMQETDPLQHSQFTLEKQAEKKEYTRNEHQDDQEDAEFTPKLDKNFSGTSNCYKKKNTQSNVVNQTFSFLLSDRSRSIVASFFKNETSKVQDYYKVMAKVKQSSKKYINRKYLQKLLDFAPKTEFQRAFIKAKLSFLTIDEVRQAIRILMYNFLRGSVYQTLLTSSKIYKETLFEHFWRKRQIMRFLFNHQK